jgi:hypothetical protein
LNYGEFAIIDSKAGLNICSFRKGIWEETHNRDSNPIEFEGIRIQAERLRKLNHIAIQQMRLLLDDTRIKRLEAGDK